MMRTAVIRTNMNIHKKKNGKVEDTAISMNPWIPC